VLQLSSLTLLSDAAAGGVVVALVLEWVPLPSGGFGGGALVQEVVAGSGYDPASPTLAAAQLRVGSKARSEEARRHAWM
jgi:hypothetical protein